MGPPVQPLHVNELSGQEAERQRLPAQACLPSVKLFDRADDPTGTGYLPRYSATLPTHMVAAYMAPNVFEDGRTNTVSPPLPIF